MGQLEQRGFSFSRKLNPHFIRDHSELGFQCGFVDGKALSLNFDRAPKRVVRRQLSISLALEQNNLVCHFASIAPNWQPVVVKKGTEVPNFSTYILKVCKAGYTFASKCRAAASSRNVTTPKNLPSCSTSL